QQSRRYWPGRHRTVLGDGLERVVELDRETAGVLEPLPEPTRHGRVVTGWNLDPRASMPRTQSGQVRRLRLVQLTIDVPDQARHDDLARDGVRTRTSRAGRAHRGEARRCRRREALPVGR